MVNFLCVAGQMRSGKNEVGDHLCRRLGFKGASFARPVKDIFCKTFGVDMDFVEYWKVRDEAPPGFDRNVRQSLQFIGDGFRKIKPTVWVDYAFSNNPSGSCFTDGRYFNELSEIRLHGGLNILVWRPHHENHDSNESEAHMGRVVKWFVSSEIPEGRISGMCPSAPEGCGLIDFFVVNDGTISDLEDKLDRLVLSEIYAG
jgi:hypothetical protein